MTFREWLKFHENVGGAGLATPRQEFDRGLFRGLARYKPPVDTLPKSRMSQKTDKLFKGSNAIS